MFIVLGEVKVIENDGLVSYIGGYNYEVVFLMIIVSFIFVLGLIERNVIKFWILLFIVVVFFFILVNYRIVIFIILFIVVVFYYLLVE